MGAILLLCANGFSAAAEDATGVLVVSIVGIPSGEGVVRFGIYGGRAAFDARLTRPELEGDCPIAGNRCDFTIPDLRHGEYAVMAYHDKNMNGDYDWGIFDRERVGVSNYGRRLWMSPDYDQARFVHNDARTAIEIRLY
jgi:uncharacterized protein (DUF2141 family)